jgi:hypothetical protein
MGLLPAGAPDLFTQIAAVAAGKNVDQELAIGWAAADRAVQPQCTM